MTRATDAPAARPGRGRRVALGCGIGCAAVAVAGAGLLGWLWVTTEADPHLQAYFESNRIDGRLRALPFDPPPDGRVPEERLLVLLGSSEAGAAYLRDSPEYQKFLKEGAEDDDTAFVIGGTTFQSLIVAGRVRLEAGLGDREQAWIHLALAETDWDVPASALAELGAPLPRSADAESANRALFRRHADRILRAVDVERLRRDIRSLRREAAGDFGTPTPP